MPSNRNLKTKYPFIHPTAAAVLKEHRSLTGKETALTTLKELQPDLRREILSSRPRFLAYLQLHDKQQFDAMHFGTSKAYKAAHAALRGFKAELREQILTTPTLYSAFLKLHNRVNVETDKYFTNSHGIELSMKIIQAVFQEARDKLASTVTLLSNYHGAPIYLTYLLKLSGPTNFNPYTSAQSIRFDPLPAGDSTVSKAAVGLPIKHGYIAYVPKREFRFAIGYQGALTLMISWGQNPLITNVESGRKIPPQVAATSEKFAQFLAEGGIETKSIFELAREEPHQLINWAKKHEDANTLPQEVSEALAVVLTYANQTTTATADLAVAEAWNKLHEFYSLEVPINTASYLAAFKRDLDYLQAIGQVKEGSLLQQNAKKIETLLSSSDVTTQTLFQTQAWFEPIRDQRAQHNDALWKKLSKELGTILTWYSQTATQDGVLKSKFSRSSPPSSLLAETELGLKGFGEKGRLALVSQREFAAIHRIYQLRSALTQDPAFLRTRPIIDFRNDLFLAVSAARKIHTIAHQLRMEDQGFIAALKEIVQITPREKIQEVVRNLVRPSELALSLIPTLTATEIIPCGFSPEELAVVASQIARDHIVQKRGMKQPGLLLAAGLVLHEGITIKAVNDLAAAYVQRSAQPKSQTLTHFDLLQIWEIPSERLAPPAIRKTYVEAYAQPIEAAMKRLGFWSAQDFDQLKAIRARFDRLLPNIQTVETHDGTSFTTHSQFTGVKRATLDYVKIESTNDTEAPKQVALINPAKLTAFEQKLADDYCSSLSLGSDFHSALHKFLRVQYKVTEYFIPRNIVELVKSKLALS